MQENKLVKKLNLLFYKKTAISLILSILSTAATIGLGYYMGVNRDRINSPELLLSLVLSFLFIGRSANDLLIILDHDEGRI